MGEAATKLQAVRRGQQARGHVSQGRVSQGRVSQGQQSQGQQARGRVSFSSTPADEGAAAEKPVTQPNATEAQDVLSMVSRAADVESALEKAAAQAAREAAEKEADMEGERAARKRRAEQEEADERRWQSERAAVQAGNVSLKRAVAQEAAKREKRRAVLQGM